MRHVVLTLLLFTAAACNKPAASTAAAPTDPAGKAPAWGNTPANAPAAQPGAQPGAQPASQPRPASPHGAQPGSMPGAQGQPGAAPAAVPTQATGDTLKGTVEEAIHAGPYTYLKLSQGAGQAAMWAAVPTTNIPVGTGVQVLVSTVMTDFYSNTLKRGFPVVIFGTLAGGRLPDGSPVAPNPKSPQH